MIALENSIFYSEADGNDWEKGENDKLGVALRIDPQLGLNMESGVKRKAVSS